MLEDCLDLIAHIYVLEKHLILLLRVTENTATS